MRTGMRLAAAALLMILTGCTGGFPDGPPESPGAGNEPNVPETFAGWFDRTAVEDLDSLMPHDSPPQEPHTVTGPDYHAAVTRISISSDVDLDGDTSQALHLTAGSFVRGSTPQPGSIDVITLHTGAGYQFVTALLDPDGDRNGLSKVDSLLKIGDRIPVKLGRLPRATVLIAVAPERTPVVLITGGPGPQQTIDLRTGRAGTTGVPAHPEIRPSAGVVRPRPS